MQSGASGLSEGSMLQSINSSLLPAYTAALTFGYFCGSVPFGLILTRLAGTADIRSIGSGNIGATNVLRTGRKGLALATLLGDALKGSVAIALVYAYYGRDYEYFAHEMAMPAALGAFLGHLFPVWLGFKGGKGVATYIGVLAGLMWQAALLFCAVWIVVAFALRYSSLSALIACAVTPIALWFWGRPDLAAVFAGASAIVFIKHRANIARLIAGTEGRIGAKG